MMGDYATFAEREREGWSSAGIAAAFRHWFGPAAEVGARRLVEIADPRPHQEVLDLCCGQGAMTRMLRATGAHVVALDFSETMLEAARANAPRAEYHLGDAQDLPFDAGRFDAVLCSLGIPHLPDQPRALAEVARVLRPGGRFAMSAWVGPEASPAFAAILGPIREHAEPGLIPKQPDLNRFARPAEAEPLIAEAGLRYEGIERLKAVLEIESPDQLFEAFSTGTVAVSMLLRDQPRERVAAILAGSIAAVRLQPQTETGWQVAMPLAVLSATRPD
ncbi:class I SAM-dependent methyltransferase [Limimaricola pyoseonensis]|uniref:Methyltransferase domain-containing protein n=1 Tax=Limimaricola pyoseonensis TaxID=521013 RepID=A0A1G7JY69_9RHOB|nr:class I SAM-dependent methyltransferase [Limimaricola pyoseonensis]SDF29850.1 Methyltransferase domain-containing protein [Limimaricola pyoseonensis]